MQVPFFKVWLCDVIELTNAWHTSLLQDHHAGEDVVSLSVFGNLPSGHHLWI